MSGDGLDDNDQGVNADEACKALKRTISDRRVAERKIACELCGNVCLRHQITLHLYTEHIKTKGLRCRYCGYSTAFRTSNIRQHVRTKHPGRPANDYVDKRWKYLGQRNFWYRKCFPSVKPRAARVPGSCYACPSYATAATESPFTLVLKKEEQEATMDDEDCGSIFERTGPEPLFEQNYSTEESSITAITSSRIEDDMPTGELNPAEKPSYQDHDYAAGALTGRKVLKLVPPPSQFVFPTIRAVQVLSTLGEAEDVFNRSEADIHNMNTEDPSPAPLHSLKPLRADRKRSSETQLSTADESGKPKQKTNRPAAPKSTLTAAVSAAIRERSDVQIELLRLVNEKERARIMKRKGKERARIMKIKERLLLNQLRLITEQRMQLAEQRNVEFDGEIMIGSYAEDTEEPVEDLDIG